MAWKCNSRKNLFICPGWVQQAKIGNIWAEYWLLWGHGTQWGWEKEVLRELVGKLMSKPFQRYVIVARKPAANALPTGYLYTWYHRALQFASSTNTYFPSPHPGTSENSHRHWQNSFDNESYWNHSWMVNTTEEWDRDINEEENYSLNLRLNLKT